MRSSLLMVGLALIVGAGCSNAPDPAPAASTPAAPAASTPVAPATSTPIAPAEETAAAAKATPAANPSPSGAWYWTETFGSGTNVRALDPARYRIEFADATTLKLQADCNQGRASYTLSNAGEFRTGPVALTKMGCPDDSQDQQFLADLGRGRKLTATADSLGIVLDDGLRTMQFRRSPNAVK